MSRSLLLSTRAGVTAATVGVLSRTVSACPVCFGASDGPLLHGSNMGILALLAVTLGMLAAFALFALRLARRARRSDVGTRPAIERSASAAAGRAT